MFVEKKTCDRILEDKETLKISQPKPSSLSRIYECPEIVRLYLCVSIFMWASSERVCG